VQQLKKLNDSDQFDKMKNMMMLRSIILFGFICLFLNSHAQKIEMLTFDDLKSRVAESNDTLYVVNFWATWCKPCIEELPYFENCNQDYKNGKFKMMLVNLDFNSRVSYSVEPFVKKKNLRSEVLHINDTDPNTWINKVDSNWSGAIPATIMYKNGRTLFFKEGSMEEKELRDQIEKNK